MPKILSKSCTMLNCGSGGAIDAGRRNVEQLPVEMAT